MSRPQFGGRHIMVDLETLSTGKTAASTQIGAVAFYPAEGRVSLTERLNVHVDMASTLGMGFTMDPDTILWWLGQSDDARWAFINGQKEAVPLPHALQQLADFIQVPPGHRGMGQRPQEPAGVWGHGATFDVAILEHSYDQVNLKTPWDFRRARDTRTIFALACDTVIPRNWEPDTVAHVAVSDAVDQAYQLMFALHALGLGPEVQPYRPDEGLPQPTAGQLHPE